MGNFVQTISDRIAIIASDRLWLEDAAVQQTKTTAQLAGMEDQFFEDHFHILDHFLGLSDMPV